MKNLNKKRKETLKPFPPDRQPFPLDERTFSLGFLEGQGGLMNNIVLFWFD